MFWKLLDKSVILTGVVWLALTVTCCYLWGSGQIVPPNLLNAFWAAMGYFIGGKVPELLKEMLINKREKE